MNDVLDALEAETDGLAQFLENLTDDQWWHPSACEGWSVSDVVLHLAQSEEGVISAFDQGSAAIPLAPYVRDAVPGGDGAVDAIVDAAVRAERPDNPADALDRWREAHAAVRKRLREADLGLRLNWISVPLSPRTLAATRIAEHWIHGMDIRESLDDPAPDTDRLWFVARLAWRTLPYAFGQAGKSAPSVALHLTAPDGDTWEFGDAESAVTIAGSAGEWCRLAGRRLRPEDTALSAEGPGGDRVLELVRTYA